MVMTMIDLPHFEDHYNPKLDKRMLVDSNLYWNMFGSYCDLIMVYDGVREPLSNDDIDLLYSKKLYELLLRQGVSLETLTEGCKLFNFYLQDDKRSRLHNYLLQMSVSDPFDEACQLFFFIVKKAIFCELSTKFAIIAFNALLVRNKILPIIFYVGFTITVCELIQAGLTVESLKEILYKCFETSIKFNQKRPIVSLQDMISKLQDIEQGLRENWGVKQLFITGSFARETNNEYSDLDIIVSLRDESVDIELQKHLEEYLLVPVDLIKSSEQFASQPDLIRYRVGVF